MGTPRTRKTSTNARQLERAIEWEGIEGRGGRRARAAARATGRRRRVAPTRPGTREREGARRGREQAGGKGCQRGSPHTSPTYSDGGDVASSTAAAVAAAAAAARQGRAVMTGVAGGRTEVAARAGRGADTNAMGGGGGGRESGLGGREGGGGWPDEGKDGVNARWPPRWSSSSEGGGGGWGMADQKDRRLVGGTGVGCGGRGDGGRWGGSQWRPPTATAGSAGPRALRAGPLLLNKRKGMNVQDEQSTVQVRTYRQQ